jgi:hypothetical protein
VSTLLSSFLKQLQADQDTTTSYSASGKTNTASSASSLVVDYAA